MAKPSLDTSKTTLYVPRGDPSYAELAAAIDLLRADKQVKLRQWLLMGFNLEREQRVAREGSYPPPGALPPGQDASGASQVEDLARNRPGVSPPAHSLESVAATRAPAMPEVARESRRPDASGAPPGLAGLM
jgi:hypothetical protein